MIKINNKQVKGAILDMDGVLWRGEYLLCDIREIFRAFAHNQVKVMLATNNGLRTVADYVEKFSGYGVNISPDQVISSAIAVAALAKKDFPQGGPVYVMGERALFSTVEEYGFYHSVDAPQAVIAGLTKNFTYDMIKDTSLAIQRGIPFYYTNLDPTYPSPEGNIPGAGTILAALETASGVKAKLAGKPLPFMFQVAMERMQTQPDETLVIGDRLTTDIKGGQDAGCLTAMTLSGVSTIEDYNQWEPKPDLLLEDISSLFSM